MKCDETLSYMLCQFCNFRFFLTTLLLLSERVLVYLRRCFYFLTVSNLACLKKVFFIACATWWVMSIRWPAWRAKSNFERARNFILSRFTKIYLWVKIRQKQRTSRKKSHVPFLHTDWAGFLSKLLNIYRRENCLAKNVTELSAIVYQT